MPELGDPGHRSANQRADLPLNAGDRRRGRSPITRLIAASRSVVAPSVVAARVPAAGSAPGSPAGVVGMVPAVGRARPASARPGWDWSRACAWGRGGRSRRRCSGKRWCACGHRRWGCGDRRGGAGGWKRRRRSRPLFAAGRPGGLAFASRRGALRTTSSRRQAVNHGQRLR